MRIFFGSSFFILTMVALLCGAFGALSSGMWDLKPPDPGIYSFGSYSDGTKIGATLAAMGLIPYWIFHMILGDAFRSWEDLDNKIQRVAWVVCWASFLGWFFSRSQGI